MEFTKHSSKQIFDSDSDTQRTSKRSDSSLESTSKKKKFPCYFYFNFGTCKCEKPWEFIHKEEELENKLSSINCFFYSQKKCNFKRCRFFHPKNEERNRSIESRSSHKMKREQRKERRESSRSSDSTSYSKNKKEKVYRSRSRSRTSEKFKNNQSRKEFNPPYDKTRDSYESKPKRDSSSEESYADYRKNKLKREKSESPDNSFSNSNFEKTLPKNKTNNAENAKVSNKKKMERKEIKILVLGETGAGKSSLINLFYVWSNEWKPQEIINKRVLIRTEHLDGDGGAEKNVKNQGESQTFEAKLYNFELVNEDTGCLYSLSFLDTPGLGDTNGLAKDDENIDMILEESVKKTDNLNAILVVANGSDGRNNSRVNYVSTRLQGMLPKSLYQNLVFLLTNVDLKPSLDLSKVFGYNIDPKRIFYYNNQLFQLGPDDFNNHNTVRKLKQSFIGSIETLSAMLDFMSTCTLKPTGDFKKIKESRDKLKQKLVECNDAEARIYKKKLELQDMAAQLADGKLKIDDLQKKLNQTITEETFEELQTPYHNTTCLTCKNCCHEKCSLNEMTTQGDLNFQRCWAFGGSSSVCNLCKHDYTSHIHLRLKYKKETKQVQKIDPNIQQAIQSTQNNYGSQQKVQTSINTQIQKLDDELKQYHQQIRDVIFEMQSFCSRFDYIKEIEACLTVLDEQIEIATNDFSRSGSKNDGLKLDGLKKTQKEMAKLKKNLIQCLKTK